jgi:hypothetical protein
MGSQGEDASYHVMCRSDRREINFADDVDREAAVFRDVAGLSLELSAGLCVDAGT